MRITRNLGTIASRMVRRQNNFDLLRFVAATFVIISHTLALAGFNIQPQIGNMTIGSIGVSIFFVISGFLVSGSWDNHPRVGAFLGKRIVRIVPGLAGVSIFTALIIGPIFTTLPLREYLLSPDTYAYLLNTAIFPLHYTLPSVFWDNIAGGIVNGSIWSLPLEFLVYLGLIAAAILGLFKRKTGFVLLVAIILAVTCALVFLIRNPELLFGGIKILWLVKYGAFFMMGSAFYLYRQQIVLTDTRALLALIVVVGSTAIPGQFVLTLLTLPYLILYLAFMPNRWTESFGSKGDFSYGMYIYAWPVQQSIVALSDQKIGLLHLFMYEFPAILALAIASWYLVEKPSLRLKSHFGKDRYPVHHPAATNSPGLKGALIPTLSLKTSSERQ